MKYLITNFSNIAYLPNNAVCISTCNSDPKFYHDNSYNKNKFCIAHGHFLGIREDAFLLPEGVFESLEERCQANCPYKYKNPHCQFLEAYRAHLDTIDFEALLAEFERVADVVRKITPFEGEPIITLLVWEGETNLCSERWALIDLFKKHGLELKSFTHTREGS